MDNYLRCLLCFRAVDNKHPSIVCMGKKVKNWQSLKINKLAVTES